MSGLFSPSMPKPPIPPPVAPDLSGEQAQSAAEAARRRLAAATGRSSLLLTTGNQTPAPSQQKYLLGA